MNINFEKTINNNYDRAIQQFQPGGKTQYGRDEVVKFWKKLRDAFKQAVFRDSFCIH